MCGVTMVPTVKLTLKCFSWICILKVHNMWSSIQACCFAIEKFGNMRLECTAYVYIHLQDWVPQLSCRINGEGNLNVLEHVVKEIIMSSCNVLRLFTIATIFGLAVAVYCISFSIVRSEYYQFVQHVWYAFPTRFDNEIYCRGDGLTDVISVWTRSGPDWYEAWLCR